MHTGVGGRLHQAATRIVAPRCERQVSAADRQQQAHGRPQKACVGQRVVPGLLQRRSVRALWHGQGGLQRPQTQAWPPHHQARRGVFRPQIRWTLVRSLCGRGGGEQGSSIKCNWCVRLKIQQVRGQRLVGVRGSAGGVGQLTQGRLRGRGKGFGNEGVPAADSSPKRARWAARSARTSSLGEALCRPTAPASSVHAAGWHRRSRVAMDNRHSAKLSS